MLDWVTFAGIVLLGCLSYIGRRALTSRNPHPLPPGPPGLPWIGNVIGINASTPWTTYAEWAKTYGDIVHSRLMGKDIIIINSEKIARDLFEKRSGNYSDRADLITTELYGQDFNTPLMPYSNRWRLHKRFFHQTFRLGAVDRFKDLQDRKACRFIRQLFDTPEHLDDHLFEYTASLSLNSTYAYDPASRKDDVVDIAARILDVLAAAFRPDLAVVLSAFPLLLHLPSWFPGMSFKKDMEIAHAATREYLERPFEYSISQLKMQSSSGVAPCMVFDGIETIGEKENSAQMVALQEAAAASFLAASETSKSLLLTVFLFMMLNPDMQEKAQAQIDTVIGRNRLPTLEDRSLLPFVDAMLREIRRCCPVVPLLIPHVSVSDDVYEGFHIPKGSILIANAWSMAHDESRFPNPHSFTPERFLNEDGSLKPNDIDHLSFGFGRRACPGRHFADATVWGVMVRVLAVFKISRPLDENGIEMNIEPKFSSGLVIHPLPFKYRIVPRFPDMDTEKLEELIAASTT